ncbi:MAG: maleylpyruvate isomerase N-terminal domain-containing protein [Chloroflexota bacterium]|nr:maleylpyruvate isomerase N-terminal domain-containing protein [Chloroflexota bacterium]
MVASVSAAEWQRSQDALRDEVRRMTTLMRSISDPGVPAVGQWNIADVAMHLSQNWILVPGLARQDLSRYRAVVPGIAGEAGDSMIPDMWDNADMNALALKSDAERDLAVLADRIEERAEEYFGECAGHSPDEPRPWLIEGTTVPLSTLTCNLLNETIMHGYDIAKAAGRKWRIEPAHAAMVVRQFFVPVLQTCEPRTFVNAEKAAGLQATYQLHLRGGGRLNFVFDDGSLRVEEPSTRRVDCHISANPAAFFMVFWDRQSQWNAIAKGQLIAWGRKPWLGLKFRSLIRNP